MIVKVSGAKDRIFTSVLKLAASSYAKNLFSYQMIPHLFFSIRIENLPAAAGFCLVVDPYKPREFEIEIGRSKNKLLVLSTLAHEFVHAKQFAYQELQDKHTKSKMRTFWKGKDCSDLSYWDRPWEIEAYGLEAGLVAKFLQEHNKFKYFKTKQENWFIKELDDLS